MTCPVTVIIEQSISYDPVKLTLKMACALTLLITFSHLITRDRGWFMRARPERGGLRHHSEFTSNTATIHPNKLSKLKYSTLVTAETSLQFCAVLRSSAQFCAVLRSFAQFAAGGSRLSSFAQFKCAATWTPRSNS